MKSLFLLLVAPLLTAPLMATGLSPSISSFGAWGIYSDLLLKEPLLTKSLTSSATNAFSDVLCQGLVRANDNASDKAENEGKMISTRATFDAERLLHAATTGLVWSGPITHYWYKLLFGKLTVHIKDPIISLVSQILIDAVIFSPIAVSGYFALRSILEGTGVQGIREKLQNRLFPTLQGAWKFWPAANVVNFGLVPLHFRVLFMNVLSVFWSGYLTHVNSKLRTS